MSPMLFLRFVAMLACILAGAAALGAPVVLPEVVASVNGAEIKKAELEKAFNFVVVSRGKSPEAVPLDQRGPAYQTFLDSLILARLLSADPAAAALPIRESDMTSEYNEIKQRYPSEQAMKDQFGRYGISEEQVLVYVRDSLREEAWLRAQTPQNLAASDQEIADYFQKNPERFGGRFTLEQAKLMMSPLLRARKKQEHMTKLRQDLLAQPGVHRFFPAP